MRALLCPPPNFPFSLNCMPVVVVVVGVMLSLCNATNFCDAAMRAAALESRQKVVIRDRRALVLIMVVMAMAVAVTMAMLMIMVVMAVAVAMAMLAIDRVRMGDLFLLGPGMAVRTDLRPLRNDRLNRPLHKYHHEIPWI